MLLICEEAFPEKFPYLPNSNELITGQHCSSAYSTSLAQTRGAENGIGGIDRGDPVHLPSLSIFLMTATRPSVQSARIATSFSA